jgi:hypothetical protein
MKKVQVGCYVVMTVLIITSGGCHRAQKTETTGAIVKPAQMQDKVVTQDAIIETKSQQKDNTRSDQQLENRAADWVKTLNLGDAEKDARVAAVIASHMKAVRDWHNEHPLTTVPAGINPVTGNPLNNVDREVIADSAMPKSVHENLMSGLAKDLTKEQVEAILDKYTVGKVAFTMNGYRAIVPDLTDQEAATIEGYLKEARERAIDFKSMKAISAIFEIYKTKSEQYLNSNGRNWKQMYSAFTAKIKAQKEAKARQKAADSNSTQK